MIKLDRYEQQIILACKSWGAWVVKEGRYKAVQVVVSQYYAIDINELPIETMYHCLLELFIKINENKISILHDFMNSLFKCEWQGGYKEKIDMEYIVRNLISRISNIPVKNSRGEDIFEELECDYEILNKGLQDL